MSLNQRTRKVTLPEVVVSQPNGKLTLKTAERLRKSACFAQPNKKHNKRGYWAIKLQKSTCAFLFRQWNQLIELLAIWLDDTSVTAPLQCPRNRWKRFERICRKDGKSKEVKLRISHRNMSDSRQKWTGKNTGQARGKARAELRATSLFFLFWILSSRLKGSFRLRQSLGYLI